MMLYLRNNFNTRQRPHEPGQDDTQLKNAQVQDNITFNDDQIQNDLHFKHEPIND